MKKLEEGLSIKVKNYKKPKQQKENEMSIIWGTDTRSSEDKTNNIWTTEPTDLEVYRMNNNIHFNTEVHGNSVERLIQLTYEVINDNHPVTGFFDVFDRNIKMPIYHFNSYGGDIDAMWKFIDFLDYIKTGGLIDTSCSIINSVACSAATLMAIACDVRFVTPHSTIMIHELSAGCVGYFTHIESFIKNLKFHEEGIVELYHKQSGLPKDQIKTLLLKETWLTPQDYKSLGFVKDILDMEFMEIKEEELSEPPPPKKKKKVASKKKATPKTPKKKVIPKKK